MLVSQVSPVTHLLQKAHKFNIITNRWSLHFYINVILKNHWVEKAFMFELGLATSSSGFAAWNFRNCGCFGRYLMMKFWEIFHNNSSPWFMVFLSLLTPTRVILKNFMNFSFNFCEIWGNLTQDLRLKNHPRSSGLKKRAAAWEFHIELGGHV